MKIRETDLSERQRVREPESPSHYLVKIWPKFGLPFFGQVSPWNIFPSPLLSGQPTPFMHFFSPRYQSIYGHQVWCLTLWSCGPAGSGDKLKPLVATSGYDHQNLQDGDLPWTAPTHKVTWQFNNLVLKDPVIK